MSIKVRSFENFAWVFLTGLRCSNHMAGFDLSMFLSDCITQITARLLNPGFGGTFVTKLALLNVLIKIRALPLAMLLLFATGSWLPLQCGLITYGLISFDILIPTSGQQLGVNALNVSNFTGGSFVPPDFPITTAITLQNLSLTVVQPGGSQVISLGNLGPGEVQPNLSLQFDSNVVINSVTLEGIFSPTVFQANGISYSTSIASILYVLLPSNGDSLQAGIDFGVLEIDASSTEVPEPTVLSLFLVGTFGLLSFKMGARKQ
jgi:hypothetical protein